MHVLGVKDYFYSDLKAMSRSRVLYGSSLQKTLGLSGLTGLCAVFLQCTWELVSSFLWGHKEVTTTIMAMPSAHKMAWGAQGTRSGLCRNGGRIDIT